MRAATADGSRWRRSASDRSSSSRRPSAVGTRGRHGRRPYSRQDVITAGADPRRRQDVRQRGCASRDGAGAEATGWSARVRCTGGADGFAYVPGEVVTTGGKAAVAVAQRLYPGDSIEVKELSGGVYQRLSGVPDALRLIADLRRAGLAAQPNHVFFAHDGCGCCCGPHPALVWAGGAGVQGAPVYASPDVRVAGVRLTGVRVARVRQPGVRQPDVRAARCTRHRCMHHRCTPAPCTPALSRPPAGARAAPDRRWSRGSPSPPGGSRSPRRPRRRSRWWCSTRASPCRRSTPRPSAPCCRSSRRRPKTGTSPTTMPTSASIRPRGTEPSSPV